MSINNINYNNNYSNALLLVNNQKKNSSQYENFSKNMKEILEEVSREQINAQKNTEKFELNQSNTSLNEVLIDWQKSAIAIQMAVQIRNKLISAYQEIMNQPV
ncbi:flagellar hook-basal body complex protein FliE [Buchnera aphidicola]|uniref:flagellar hook-basal body complex protein FliE n=1 Tax=Buchnera aphidicola TaxID=9 RepID=UPI0034645C65